MSITKNQIYPRGIYAKTTLTAIIALFIFWIHPLAAQSQNTFVTIGTGGLTGVYYPTGQAIAQIVNQHRKTLGVHCTVKPTDGSVYNVNAVVDGEFEFGVVQSDRQYQAVQGLSDWKETGPRKSLRAVFNIYHESCCLLAAVDANIQTLSDLKGKRLCLGNHGSGHLGNALDVLAAVGINPETDITARYIEPEQAPALLQDGKIDAFFYTVGHPNGALKEAAAGSRKVQFIPINGETLDKLVEARPYYSGIKIPIKYYPGANNDQDIQTFGVCATLVTSSRVPEPVVYAVVKSICENLETFKQQHPAFSTITPETMLECLSAPLHPGALKYFREKGFK